MGCCLSTEYQVDLVIEKFAQTYKPFDKLTPGPFPQLVAGRIVPVTQPLIAPVSGRQCVYYSVKAEELVHKTRTVRDDNGNERVEHYTEWTYRYTDKKESDFLLVDPGNPTIYVYIPFVQTTHKIHSEKDAKAVNFGQGQSCSNYMQEMRGRYQFAHNQEWRYTESCFEYGEEAAVIGIIKDASVQGGKMLGPMTKDLLTEQYFTDNNWGSWERSSWEDLTKTPCIIVTDCAKFLENRHIDVLPQTYHVPPTFQQPMYIPGYTPQPVNQQPMGMGFNNQVHPQGGFPQQQQGGFPQQQGGFNNNQQQGGFNNQQGGFNNNQQGQGGFNNNQGNFNNNQGGFNNNQGGFNNNQQGFNNQQQGGFNNNQGGFNNNQGGFNNNQGGFNNQQQGGFNNQQGGFNNNQGGFNNNQGGFNNNQGGFNNNQGGFNNQQQGGFNNQGGYPQQQGGYR